MRIPKAANAARILTKGNTLSSLAVQRSTVPGARLKSVNLKIAHF